MTDLKKLAGLVRPLEWTDYSHECSAYFFSMSWRVWLTADGLWRAANCAPDHEFIGVFQTQEAAKAAAQADYAARIIAALDGDALAAMLAEAEQRGREAEREACAAWCEANTMDVVPLTSGERVQRNDDGTLDEIVGAGVTHLEHLGGKRWFLAIGFADGSAHCLWINGKITMEEDREAVGQPMPPAPEGGE